MYYIYIVYNLIFILYKLYCNINLYVYMLYNNVINVNM